VSENHGLDQILADCNEVMLHFRGVVEKTTDADKRAMLFNNLTAAVAKVSEAVETKDQVSVFQIFHFSKIHFRTDFFAHLNQVRPCAPLLLLFDQFLF
jgi:hypothetical protein